MKSWIFDFLMNKFHILPCFDELWSLTFEFDQKVKVWLFSIQLTFDQLIENSYVNPLDLSNVLRHVIRSKWWIWILEIMSPTNNSFARSKIRNWTFLVKTLILRILPFWCSNQISWGIMIQTWSNDIYEFIMFILIKNYEVWLDRKSVV